MSSYEAWFVAGLVGLSKMNDTFMKSPQSLTDSSGKFGHAEEYLSPGATIVLSAVNWPQSTKSLSSVEKSLHAPESHFMSLWIPGGPNTAEKSCSLYCAAISHIGLCPWLPRSISIPPVFTTVECHVRALPAALSTLQLSRVTVKDSRCHS